jgi:hypothetical protein
MEKKDRIAHYQWRKKVNEEIPALVARVFALRGKTYNGCGFHYYLEHRLGLIMVNINSNIERLTFELVLKDQVFYKAFVTDLEQAEKSVIGTAPDTRGVVPRDVEVEAYLKRQFPIATLIPVAHVDMEAIEAFSRSLENGNSLQIRIYRDNKAQRDFVEYAVVRVENKIA